jgi:hypothetical protein
MKAQFIRYEEFKKNWWRAQFEVKEHAFLPDGEYDFDTLLGFGIPVPSCPDFFHWQRDRFYRLLKNAYLLRTIENS